MNIGDETGDFREGTVKDWLKGSFRKTDFHHLNKNNLVQFKTVETREPKMSYKDFPRMKVLTSQMLGCLSVSPNVILKSV